MPTYKTKMSDPDGSSQQNGNKQWKKRGYKFTFSFNTSSDTGQIEILPSCRCQFSVIVAAVTGKIELTHSYKILQRFKLMPYLCPSPPAHLWRKCNSWTKKKTMCFIVWVHVTMSLLPYLIMHSVLWDGGLLSPVVAWIADFCQSSSQDNFNDRQHNDDAKYSKGIIFLFSVLRLDVFLDKYAVVGWVPSNSTNRLWFDTPFLIPDYCNSGVDNTCYANRPNSMDLKKNWNWNQ